jgi:hypothetical protein
MEMGTEVKLLKDVAVVIETLERLGVGIVRTKTMYPSAYLMKDHDVYKIMHFKELLMLEGNESSLNEEDVCRRESIVELLVKWGIVKRNCEVQKFETSFIYVLPYTDKVDWKINHKYRRNLKVVE